MIKKVVVIGAGPAGMIAAGKAAEKGHDVTLVEKNNVAGKKLLISGKGRCNLTNNIDIEGLIQNIPGNGNFLYSSLYTFSNTDIIDFFEQNGLQTKVERGGRVFPVSDRAKDVVDILLDYINKNKVKLVFNAAVTSIHVRDNSVYKVVTWNKKEYEADAVIIATGGLSYPGTGSTGDGFLISKKLGHTSDRIEAFFSSFNIT